MGFGYWARSPYEVQRDNGRRFDFDKIAKHYKDTKPIRGKRAKLDIRPLYERRRTWERMFKVNDNEYYISCNAWSHIEDDNTAEHRRAISFVKSDDQETIIVHTPRMYWGDNKNKLHIHALSTSSTFYFYAFNLPSGLTMEKYKSANYIQLDTEEGKKYYTIEKGDVTFTRKVGAKYWSPLVVHRETIHTIDRKQSKVIREKAKDFVEYCNVMSALTPEPKHNWWAKRTNPFVLTGADCNKYNDVRDELPKDVPYEELLDKGEEVPEYWFAMMEIYKQKSHLTWWDQQAREYRGEYRQEKMAKDIYKDLYQVAKPCREVEVPLGEMCKDNYGSWYY